MKKFIKMMVLLLLINTLFLVENVFAEGTVNMYNWNTSGTNSRWFFNHDSYNDIQSIPNDTIISVYANEGEKIKFATSGTGAVMTKPDGTTQTITVTRSNGSVGHIYNSTQERNKSYTYKVIEADQTGVYKFFMTNVRKATSGHDYMNITPITYTSAFSSYDNNTHIAAWDIQIENADGVDINGRVWMDYISIYRGYNSYNYSRSTVKFHVLTSDGYKYEMNLNGVDPGGFNFFVGTRGFINKNTNEIYYKSISDTSLDTSLNGTQTNKYYLMPTPTYGETEYDTYGKIFFNTPSDDLPNSIKKDKLNSEIVTELSYNGTTNVGETNLFGTFSFNITEPAIYTLTIKNKTTGNVVRTISNTAVEGENKVIWNCKDNNGNYVPAGEYTAELKVRNGEYHFILYDVETLEGGFSITSEDGDHTIYYDNTTTGGASAVNGVDSSVNPLKFGTNGGDKKLLNVWTFNNEKSSIDLLMLNEDDNTKCVISGRVFKDNDNNRLFNTLKDVPLSNVRINIVNIATNEVYSTESVTNGEFAVIVPKGANYRVEVDDGHKRTILRAFVNTTNNESQVRNNVNQSINVGDIGYYAASSRKVTVKKEWDDNNNLQGARPDSINVSIKDGDNVLASFQLKANSGWTKTIDLPIRNELGDEIDYVIDEDEISALYSKNNMTVTKNGDTYTITNKYEIPNDTVDVKIVKVWNDNDNRANKRPNALTVRLYRNGLATSDTYDLTSTDNWTYTFSDLRKYNDLGEEYTYTVLEEFNDDNYTISNTDTLVEGSLKTITITNSFVPNVEKITLNVSKVWNDNNNEFGKRPTSITVNLKNGNNIVATDTLSSSNNWETSFQNVAKYDANNDEIAYVIEEEFDSIFYSQSDYQKSENDIQITNTFAVPTDKVNVKVVKTWDDNDNRANKRPSKVTVKLYRDDIEIDTNDLTENDDWTYTFDNLRKYNDVGDEYFYSVEEVLNNNNYELSYSNVTTEGNLKIFSFTNAFVHNEETTTIYVEKVWDDNNNEFGERPSSVTISLNKNDNPVAIELASMFNDWVATFESLPKFDENNDEIIYVAEEVLNNDNYEQVDYQVNDNKITIVNKYIEPTIDEPTPDSSNNPTSGVLGSRNTNNPVTGDNIYYYILLLIASIALIVTTRVVRRKINI